MATNVSVIGVATSDYTTIAAWESDVEGDFVAAGDIEKGECKDQEFTENVLFDGATTDASNYWWLTAQSGAEHDGTAGNGARNVANSSGHVFQVSDDFTRIEGLGVSHSAPAASNEGIRVTADNCIFRNLVMHEMEASDCDAIYASTSVTYTVENCIIYQFARAGLHFQATSGTVTCTVNANNCTVTHCGTDNEGESGAVNVQATAGATLNITLNLDNFIGLALDDSNVNARIFSVDNYNDAGFGTENATWNINSSISEDASITEVIDSGSGNLENRTETANESPGAGDFVIFKNITDGTEDYKLFDNATDNDAQAAGVNLDGEFTDDIIGNTRPASPTAWDIGAHEVTAGVSVAVSGTTTAGIDEDDMTGGAAETTILTLTGDTWVAAGATFDAQRAAIRDGVENLLPATPELLGWDNEVRATALVGAVVRTSPTVVTITWATAQTANYDITAQETIEVTVPAAALVTSLISVVGTPTFTVDAVAVGGRIMSSLVGAGGLVGMGGIAGQGGGLAA